MRAVTCLILLSFPALGSAADANATPTRKPRGPLRERVEDAGTTGTVKLGGRKLTFTRGSITEYEGLVIALLGSCTVENGASIATKERWDKAMKGDHLHIHFTKPRTFVAGGPHSANVDAVEILVPISPTKSPDHIFVRDWKGFRAFAKYQPDICFFIQGRMKALLEAVWRADAKKKKKKIKKKKQ
jgi:hypothetical protein